SRTDICAQSSNPPLSGQHETLYVVGSRRIITSSWASAKFITGVGSSRIRHISCEIRHIAYDLRASSKTARNDFCGNPHHDLRASNTHVAWRAFIQPH